MPGAGNPLSSGSVRLHIEHADTNIDPDGHFACNGKNSGDNYCLDITAKDLTELLSISYGWKVEGNWSKRDLNRILDVGSDIEADYFRLTGGWGAGWIRKNIGNAVFIHGSLSTRSFVVGDRVFLSPNFYGWGKAHVAHEIGHVLDNNSVGGGIGATLFGGGKSDEMVRDEEGILMVVSVVLPLTNAQQDITKTLRVLIHGQEDHMETIV